MRIYSMFTALAAGSLVLAGCQKEKPREPHREPSVTGYQLTNTFDDGYEIFTMNGVGRAIDRRAVVLDGPRAGDLSVSLENIIHYPPEPVGIFRLPNEQPVMRLNDITRHRVDFLGEALDTAKDFVLAGKRPTIRYEWRGLYGDRVYKCRDRDLSAEARIETYAPNDAAPYMILGHLGNGKSLTRKQLDDFAISQSGPTRNYYSLKDVMPDRDAFYEAARAACSDALKREAANRFWTFTP